MIVRRQNPLKAAASLAAWSCWLLGFAATDSAAQVGQSANPAMEIPGSAAGTVVSDGNDSLVVASEDSPVADEPAEELRTGPATLDAPASAPSGSVLTVTWTGPDNKNDYIAIALPALPGGQQDSYRYTRQGSPLTVKVPDAPGQYELRYIQGQSRSILQRQPLEVTAVTATLDAPPNAPSGSVLTVTWTGPDNKNDYIAIALPALPGGQQDSYRYTRQGSPLTVKVPDAPGQYELRYIQGQSRSILQRQPLQVTE